jgi:hypothetical protein
MRFCITLFTILITSFVCAQTKIRLSFKDNCSNKYLSVEYQLIKLDQSMKDYWIPSSDSIVLVEPGRYLIAVTIPEEGDNFKSVEFTREFLKNSFTQDTILIPRIMKKYTGGMYASADLGFFCCDEICDGYEAEYYENGQVRIEGKFVNGIPKKSLKKYDKDGNLIEKMIFNKNGLYKRSRYPDYELFLKNN